MNNKTGVLFILFSVFTLSVYGQLPEKPEDISPLLTGEKIPEATLKSTDGSTHSLSAIIKQKLTILLFYRGGWCPYCNRHFSELQEVEKEITALGYQLIAISPDSPENLKGTLEKHALNYSLYSDADGQLIRDIGIAYKAPEKYTGMLNKQSGGLNPGLLPVPSVFVINSESEILFEYINPDYSARLKADLLLAVLKVLK